MARTIGSTFWALAAACLSIGPTHLWADALTLKGGGELRGELQAEPRTPGKSAPGKSGEGKSAPEKSGSFPQRLSIRTLAGAIVTVEREEVDEVLRRRAVLEEYETHRRAAGDTVAAQWDLAEWCRSKSLAKERTVHLRRVVELDAEHTAAHRGLGHIRHDGRWKTNDEIMTSRGYVKHKGRFILPQELELLQAEERESEAEKGWFKRVRMWDTWLDSGRPERQADGLRELQAIRDSDAIAALNRTFREADDEHKRLLYIGILTQIEGDKPLGPLVQQSLKDDSSNVREAAVRSVRQRFVLAALPIYVRALKNELNVIVNRAGAALGALGDDSVIPALIESLVTRHNYKALVPEQTISMTTNGGAASGAVPIPPNLAAMMLTGQLPQGVQVVGGSPVRMKEVIVEQEEQNPSVLGALTALTGEDFGYDEQSWRNWQRLRNSAQVKPKANPKSVN